VSEIAVAFPADETIAGVIVSRLGVEGIAARIDRGLFGSALSAQGGQIRVMVDERDAGRARAIVEGEGRRRRPWR
jgi:hypothetical protein